MEIARFLGVSRFVQFLSSLNSLTCFFNSPIVTLSSDMLDISSARDSIQECIKQDNVFGAGVGLEPGELAWMRGHIQLRCPSSLTSDLPLLGGDTSTRPPTSRNPIQENRGSMDKKSNAYECI